MGDCGCCLEQSVHVFAVFVKPFEAIADVILGYINKIGLKS